MISIAAIAICVMAAFFYKPLPHFSLYVNDFRPYRWKSLLLPLSEYLPFY